ncbi:MAG: Rpn family recombination-promoting nuclease/putative transposase [Clostridia bacterium]|nr:Rpn family recombination-promoting nuclease/putative transposase [Clostridia bacterium]
MELLKPKIDVVFHALFREENKHLTEALISDILGKKVKIITKDKDRHLNLKYPEEKLGVMDLRTELEGGVKCNIEIQLRKYKNENERFLYYWANTYSRQLKRGEKYKELNKTISIIILDHEIQELEGIEELGTKWQIRDDKTGKRMLTEHLEIIILEIPKAIRMYEKNKKDRISQWLMFLDNPNKEEVFQIMEENKEIKEATAELYEMSRDEELRLVAELVEKGRRDDAAAMEYIMEEGLKKGMDKGLKAGIKKGIEEGRKKGRKEGIEKR